MFRRIKAALKGSPSATPSATPSASTTPDFVALYKELFNLGTKDNENRQKLLAEISAIKWSELDETIKDKIVVYIKNYFNGAFFPKRPQEIILSQCPEKEALIDFQVLKTVIESLPPGLLDHEKIFSGLFTLAAIQEIAYKFPEGKNIFSTLVQWGLPLASILPERLTMIMTSLTPDEFLLLIRTVQKYPQDRAYLEKHIKNSKGITELLNLYATQIPAFTVALYTLAYNRAEKDNVTEKIKIALKQNYHFFDGYKTDLDLSTIPQSTIAYFDETIATVKKTLERRSTDTDDDSLHEDLTALFPHASLFPRSATPRPLSDSRRESESFFDALNPSNG